MKKIETVIKPFKLEAVREALTEIFVSPIERAIRIRTEEKDEQAV